MFKVRVLGFTVTRLFNPRSLASTKPPTEPDRSEGDGYDDAE